ncbi:MAG: hypothetical protein WD043_05775 [Gemmatimonadales bacterium]
MELSKKTTILFSPELHQRLMRVAEARGVSLGELVRAACVEQYGLRSTTDRLAAVAVLAQLGLPVGTVADMKRESVPDAEDVS